MNKTNLCNYQERCKIKTMNKEGRLLVIEGADGSGKSVQVQKLRERIEETGEQVVVYDFPQYEKTFFGGKIGEYLNGKYGGFEDMHPFFPGLLFAIDRFEARDEMLEDLKAGKVVICNRYMSSNLAHGGAKLKDEEGGDVKDFINEMEKVEFEIFKIPVPDLEIIVSVPADISQKLVEKKGERSYVKGKDIAEEDVLHQKKALEIYHWLVENRDRYELVECVGENGELMSIEEVSEKVWEVVEEKFI